jgi:DNA repair exonuclease SbcCD ATPase subunit
MNDVVTRDVLKEELDALAMQIVRLLEPRFTALEKRMDAFDEKLDHLTSTLDAFLKRLDDIEKDNLARDNEMARMKRWIETIAQKTGVKLEY